MSCIGRDDVCEDGKFVTRVVAGMATRDVVEGVLAGI